MVDCYLLAAFVFTFWLLAERLLAACCVLAGCVLAGCVLAGCVLAACLLLRVCCVLADCLNFMFTFCVLNALFELPSKTRLYQKSPLHAYGSSPNGC